MTYSKIVCDTPKCPTDDKFRIRLITEYGQHHYELPFEVYNQITFDMIELLDATVKVYDDHDSQIHMEFIENKPKDVWHLEYNKMNKVIDSVFFEHYEFENSVQIPKENFGYLKPDAGVWVCSVDDIDFVLELAWVRKAIFIEVFREEDLVYYATVKPVVTTGREVEPKDPRTTTAEIFGYPDVFYTNDSKERP